MENSQLTSIGEYAFYYCSSLTSITIPEGVTSIGSHAFYDCDSLTSITIPEDVTSIGSHAFYDCDSLTSITIPEGVTSIDEGAFYGCTSLTAIHITDLAAWCNITFSDYDSNPLYYAKNLYLNGNLVTDLVILEGVTSIGKWAFYSCSSITSVTFGENSQLQSIGSRAFYDCTSLTSITIPASVTSIGDWAFVDCSSLTSINYQGTVAAWQAISKGSSWNSSTGTYTITCTDGTIAKNGTVTMN